MIHSLPLVTWYTYFIILDVEERELYKRVQYVRLDEKQVMRKETEVLNCW
jgi:hypothetical protein